MPSTTTGAGKARPRDAQATQERLLTAATEEFAQFGLAGARIDRIAQRAGTNKRMIYVYFGDKDGLYDAVIQRGIAQLAEAVPLTPHDLGAFAAARFDYMLANPQLRRIVAWRTFEQIEPTDAERRSYRAKVDAIAAAQREGKLDDAISAADLFALVVRMTESWLNAPPALHAASAGNPMSSRRLAQARTALITAVGRITHPTPPRG
jgi:AcrR family transcriptional regulator